MHMKTDKMRQCEHFPWDCFSPARANPDQSDIISLNTVGRHVNMKISRIMAQLALKKAVSIAVIAGIAVSMAACSAKQTETESQNDDRVSMTTRATESEMLETSMSEPNQSIDPVNDTSEITTESTTEETTTTKAATPTPLPVRKTTVTNAYKKNTRNWATGEKQVNKIPKVNIEGIDTTKLNKKIYNSYKDCSDFSYSYYIGKTYVSILCDGGADGCYTEWVFNISRRTGKEMTRAEMLKELGISSKKFNSRVKKAIKKYLKGDLSTKSKAYKKAISKKTLNKTTPYVNSKGKLCYITSIIDPLDGYGAEHLYGTC